jgi:predicted metal-dependent phosphoesterase TrpH
MLSIRRDQLDAFKQYLDQQGIAYRPPSQASVYQVLQVQIGAGWVPLYQSEKYPLHYRASGRLIEDTIRTFLRSTPA